eukprot:6485320-Amphidinium_carterae.1
MLTGTETHVSTSPALGAQSRSGLPVSRVRDARLLAPQEIAGELDPEPLEPRPGSTARGTVPQASGLPATRLPPDAHTGGDTPTAVPEVGAEIRELGLELGTAL